MERDQFTCQNCDSKEKTLNVHHKYYRLGFDPWDYPLSALTTLCKDCHAALRGQKVGPYELFKAIIDRLLDDGIDPEEIEAFGIALVEALDGRGESFGSMGDYLLMWGGSTNGHFIGGILIPTGEGSSSGEAAERKSDAIV